MKRALLFSVLALSACSDEPAARRVLGAHGFHDIEITGFRWLGCGKDDFYHTGFRAVSTGGQVVTGTVCSGWTKGITVRFD